MKNDDFYSAALGLVNSEVEEEKKDDFYSAESEINQETSDDFYSVALGLVDSDIKEEEPTVTTLEEEDMGEALLNERTYKQLIKDKDMQETAIRFAQDHLNYDENVSAEVAIPEFIEHFRSFDVNEFTSGMDYNIVSGLAKDAGQEDLNGANKARQRLADYTKLYGAYESLPGAFEEEGAPGAVLDYLEGIAKAPSTWVSLVPGLFTAGAGGAAVKASAAGASQVAKLGVKEIIKQYAKKALPSELAQAAARNPVKTAILTEATAAGLQNLGAQQTEQEIGFRKDISKSELFTTAALGGGFAGLIPAAGKYAFSSAISKKSDIDISEIQAKIVKDNEKADEEAMKVLTSAKNDFILNEITTDLRAISQEVKAPGEKFLAEKANALGIVNDFTLDLDPSRSKRILAAGVEMISEGKYQIRPGDRISESISRALNKLHDEVGEETAKKKINAIYKKYNISSDDIALASLKELSGALAVEATKAGTVLNARSQAAKQLRSLTDATTARMLGVSTETYENFVKINKKAEANDMRGALRVAEGGADKVSAVVALDDLRRAMMTSQTATTFRNIVSGYTREYLFDVPTKFLDRSIATAIKGLSFGKLYKDKADLFTSFSTGNKDTLAIVYGTLDNQRSKAVKELATAIFPERFTKVFRALEDISNGSGKNNLGPKTQMMNQIARQANAFNTLSDNYFKQAAFYGNINRALNEAAARLKAVDPKADLSKFNFDKILKDNNLRFVMDGNVKVKNAKGEDVVIWDGKKAMDKVVEETLYFTFQRQPTSGAGKMLIDFAHSVPFVTTSFMPFPRFVANALRFTYEYSPLYLGERGLKFLTGKAKGDNFEEAAKGLVGLGALTGAMAFRDSEYAGANWYEGKTADGKTFDMRPFFPAAPYLFFADIINRLKKGEPVTGTSSIVTDIVQVLSGTQFRAGLGIYTIDRVIKDLFSAKENKTEIAADFAANFVGNIASTFTIPLTAGQDIYNTYLAPDEARVVRQQDKEIENVKDFLELTARRAMARIPGNYAVEEYLGEQLGVDPSEYYESPTRAENVRRILPISRQVTGVLFNERKNYFEKEMIRLKIPRSKIAKRTRSAEANQLYNTTRGEYVSNILVPYMKSEQYQTASDAARKVLITSHIEKYKSSLDEIVENYAKIHAEDRYGKNPIEKVTFENSNILKEYKKTALDLYRNTFPDEPVDYVHVLAIAKAIRQKFKAGTEFDEKLPF